MLFSLDVRRARKGDCLLLHFGDKNDPGLVMIDGGPKAVYKPHLKPRLTEIRKKRGLTNNEPLPVDVLMISHVDDDHIRGILDLTKEEVIAKQEQRPQMLNVLGLWHNSFDAIIDHTPDELTASVKSQFGTASTEGGKLPDGKKAEVKDIYLADNPDMDPGEADTVFTGSMQVLASIEQGFRLRLDGEFLNYDRNPEFNGKLVVAKKGGKPLAIAQGLKFTVVGPMQAELAALKTAHKKWLEDLKKKGKSPPEALAAYVDKSVPNLSSIVVMAELSGKRMLLTGDARGDKILEGLQLTGLLGPGQKSIINVDVLKVPHHGSANNLETGFFKRIIAKHYVFSGNGEHGNPERESLQMLLDARGEDADYTIRLTYPIAEIDVERKKDWDEARASEKKRKEKNSKAKVRKAWSIGTNSLTGFFKDHKKFAKKVSIVDKTKPHVIDLGEPLGF
jgi:hypothetical protein